MPKKTIPTTTLTGRQMICHLCSTGKGPFFTRIGNESGHVFRHHGTWCLPCAESYGWTVELIPCRYGRATIVDDHVEPRVIQKWDPEMAANLPQAKPLS